MLISEFAKKVGVSVRTLHYYDSIGLLKPAYIDSKNGYRYYDETSEKLINKILHYKNMNIPIKEIRTILDGEVHISTALLAERQALINEREIVAEKLRLIESELAHPQKISEWFDKVLSDYNYSGFTYAQMEQKHYFAWGKADFDSDKPFTCNCRFRFGGLEEMLRVLCVFIMYEHGELDSYGYTDIEKIIGKPMNEIIQELVFIPLKMFDTSFGGAFDVVGYDSSVKIPITEGMCIVTTAEDIEKLCIAIINEELISGSLFQQFLCTIGCKADKLERYGWADGVYTELIVDLECHEFFLSVRNTQPVPSDRERIMYYPVEKCDDGWVKLEIWNMQSGSQAEIYSVSIYDDNAKLLYTLPLHDKESFINVYNDGEERNAEEFLPNGTYSLELQLDEIISNYESINKYVIEVRAHSNSESGAMLGAVYMADGEWVNIPYYIFNQPASAYPLFIEALCHAVK